MRAIHVLTAVVMLIMLASCSGTGETGLSYEQFRQKVESIQVGPDNKLAYRPLAKYKEILGQPEKEQATPGQYILYYRVREGRAQVILEGAPHVGYAVEVINLW